MEAANKRIMALVQNLVHQAEIMRFGFARLFGLHLQGDVVG